ncbi:aldo/keto reductase [Mucilaginibacter galii]|uniref:L-fucose dehydrogenase n=1 Tax=Mucilaginibacter galii TaxID=2005073 RepID=A0A917JAE3_9SPHI|nr:aldo/keto reductase [Mucilaginibacter galii]GGI50069.1 L-fucose dehydrogenase [Mucilaginibacter galii]
MKDLILPQIIFGTSGLGNLYVALPHEVKCQIVSQSIQHSQKPAVFDSAGKYGAGLALEDLGKCLQELNIAPKDVLISNKLGWVRTELKTPEPTFEPGVWIDLKHDAVQKISYEGILECYEQGNELLGIYDAQLVSVHDPDEYMAAATSEADKTKRYQDILDAYRALAELKQQGKVKAIGVGAKDWKIIQKISADIDLDWAMIANSMTLHSHPQDLLDFMTELENKGTAIINSAVFNAGFLTGGNFYNYREVLPQTPEGDALINWRNQFYEICREHEVDPATACVKFGLNAPGVTSIALSTTNPNRVASNIEMKDKTIPEAFWQHLNAAGLISESYFPNLIQRLYPQ